LGGIATAAAQNGRPIGPRLSGEKLRAKPKTDCKMLAQLGKQIEKLDPH